jgi:hypothetical protein
MKNIELCEHCIYGRTVKKDNAVIGRTCELPISAFLSNKHDKNEPDDECSDFVKSDKCYELEVK